MIGWPSWPHGLSRPIWEWLNWPINGPISSPIRPVEENKGPNNGGIFSPLMGIRLDCSPVPGMLGGQMDGTKGVQWVWCTRPINFYWFPAQSHRHFPKKRNKNRGEDKQGSWTSYWAFRNGWPAQLRVRNTEVNNKRVIICFKLVNILN